MNSSAQHKKTSTAVIIVTALIAVFSICSLALLMYYLSYTHHIAFSIYQLSRLRGLSQRYVLFEIAQKDSDVIKNEIMTGQRYLTNHRVPVLEKINIEEIIVFYNTRIKELNELHTADLDRTVKNRELIRVCNEIWDYIDESLLFMQRESANSKNILMIALFILLTALVSSALLFIVAKVAIRDRLEYNATFDHLTGLYNRAAWHAAVQQLFTQAMKEKKAAALAVLDIDYFKKINDTYGHPAGDTVLKHVAAQLRASVRSVDLLARIGGEEFGILMMDTQVSGALFLIERIRKNVEQMKIKNIPAITISAGLAEYRNHATFDALFADADKALYSAKANGRNQVVVADTGAASVDS